MIVQPEKVTRNVNESFYEDERKQIATLNNEFFQNVELTDQENKVLVWLCGLDGYTAEAVVSPSKKVMESRCQKYGKVKFSAEHDKETI